MLGYSKTNVLLLLLWKADEEANHESTQGKNKKGDSPSKMDTNGHQIEKQISTIGDPHIH